MTGRVIVAHSFKGGTGKTIILTNLAAIFASEGKKVCLLDMDLRAPSLGTTFKKDTHKKTVNDFLNGRCQIEDVLIDVQDKFWGKDRFLVGLADHTPNAIREIIAKDKKWEMKAFQRIISLKKTLTDQMDMDYILLDTSPGVGYSSLNAISNADLVIVVSVFDESDINGTKDMIRDIYKLLEKKIYIVLNKVPMELFISKDERKSSLKKIEYTLNKPILAMIPCYCEVLKSNRASIFTLENPQHNFTKILYELSGQIKEIS